MLQPFRASDVFVAIGHVRHSTGMTSRAIHYYESEGLIAVRRDARGGRLYDQATIDRLGFVGQARRAGLSIAEVRHLLAIGDRDGDAVRATLAEELYRARLADLEAQRVAVEHSALALGLRLQPQRPQLVAS